MKIQLIVFVFLGFLLSIFIQPLLAQETYIKKDVKLGFLKEELNIIDSSEINQLSNLVSENLRDGIFNLNFVGDANVQNSINSGKEFSSDTGIGLVLDQFWLGERNLFRQFNFNLSVNVASSADTIFSILNEEGEVLNKRDFGSFLLLPKNSPQSATLAGSIYFNSFGDDALTITKFISGFNFEIIGSNSNWKYGDQNINMAALSLRAGIFHEFIPDNVRYFDGYSITFGLNYSSRYIMGDLHFDKFQDAKYELLNANRSTFHGLEFSTKFKFRNIIATVSTPFILGGEVPGLTKSQFITSIGFVGGFPLKLKNTKINNNGNNSLGI
ncbi:hypothetical protein N9231_02565 [Saprospiraceae bacterium]|nr:hypothetical protein [Saprospiraceae bacterium]